MSVPAAPTKLSTKARRLWTETLEVYDLAAHELLILENACREFTLIERMERDIQALKSLMDKGSMGQRVAHDLVKEIRQHRAEFSRLIRALELPTEEPVAASRSVSARAAAEKRWRTRTA